MNEVITISEPLPYVAEASIVINAANDPWASPAPAVKTAREISSDLRVKNTITNQYEAMKNRVNKVRDYLIENYDELEDHADEIAQLLGIDLTKSVEVQIEVTFTATIAIPVGKSIDDLSEYDFDVDLMLNESGFEIENWTSNVDSVYEI